MGLKLWDEVMGFNLKAKKKLVLTGQGFEQILWLHSYWRKHSSGPYTSVPRPLGWMVSEVCHSSPGTKHSNPVGTKNCV